MSDRPPTSRDVARRAGVSQSAVSRAFTPGASISPEMRERIERAAAELRYRPNLLPGMMLKGRTGIVAVVVGGFYNPFYAMTLEAFTRALTAAGRQIMLIQIESDRALDDAVGKLAGYRVDGVVSALSVTSQTVADALSTYRVPIVTLNSAVETEWVRSVRSDNRAAGMAAARLLHDRGGTRFAYVAGPVDSMSQVERGAGFREALAALGLPPPLDYPGDYHHAGGHAAGRAMLARAERPDAIFCANDLTALGVIDALRAGGLDCPGDVRIIGYDNIEAASWPGYALATFDQRVDEMVALAVAMLCDPPGGDAIRTVQPLLVDRASAGG